MNPAGQLRETQGKAAARPSPATEFAAPSLDEILSRLLTEMDADGVGLAALRDDAVFTLREIDPGQGARPWHDRPQLPQELSGTATALTSPSAGGAWLLAPVWATPPLEQPWLLWLHRRSAWRDGDLARLAREAALLGGRLAELLPLEIKSAQCTAHLDQTAWIAGRLAHDFGNFLTGILGFTELALGQVVGDSVAHRYLKEVWQSSRQGAQWVHQLQMFGRRAAVNHIPSTAAQVLGELAAHARQQQARIHVTLPDGLPSIAIEPDALRNALVPLLDNAREASGTEGVVTLSTTARQLDERECLRWLGRPRPGPAVEIAIADAGPGLSHNVRARLFREAFFSGKPRHRGLGLAMTYGIVQAYRGGLRLDDNAPQGVIARVVLPRADAAKPERTRRSGRAASAARILLVDDDAQVIETASTKLSAAGYRVRAVGHPQAALEAYDAEPFELVISDLCMPGMNGQELARRIEARDPQARFLFISSEASIGGEFLPRHGAFLAKPFAGQALLDAVRLALAAPQGNGAGPPGARPATTSKAATTSKPATTITPTTKINLDDDQQ
jgi:signal transduction histidine kinase/CheY-like chemotaxis protein